MISLEVLLTAEHLTAELLSRDQARSYHPGRFLGHGRYSSSEAQRDIRS